MQKKHVTVKKKLCRMCPSIIGAWRSLVAHLHGAQEVVGSNPAAPTIFLLSPFTNQNKFWTPQLPKAKALDSNTKINFGLQFINSFILIIRCTMTREICHIRHSQNLFTIHHSFNIEYP